MYGIKNITFTMSKDDILKIMQEMGVKTFEQLAAQHAILTGFPLSANCIRRALRHYDDVGKGVIGEKLSCQIMSMYRLFLQGKEIKRLKTELEQCKKLESLH